MANWPGALVREIAERRVIFFVGAGLSKAAHAAFPSWPELLRRLADKLTKNKDRVIVRQLINQGRMLDAAQIVGDGIPRADLTGLFREIFQIRPTPTHAVYDSLLQMDPKTIVTTNYDEFLEKNFEHFSGGTATHSICIHTQSKLLTDLRSPIRSIVKMHGCVSDPSRLVLDRRSYYNAKRGNTALFATIEALMTVNTVLFIGYSINDPDIQLILENINLHMQSDHPHYALMSKFEHASIRSALTDTYNVSFIEYPAGAHAEVPAAIEDLRQKVKSVRATRGIV